jgi:hypothetical protein
MGPIEIALRKAPFGKTKYIFEPLVGITFDSEMKAMISTICTHGKSGVRPVVKQSSNGKPPINKYVKLVARAANVYKYLLNKVTKVVLN